MRVMTSTSVRMTPFPSVAARDTEGPTARINATAAT